MQRLKLALDHLLPNKKHSIHNYRPTMAGNDLILLTGGTGFIGFRTLQYALRKGYHVRAAVRSNAKAERLRNNPTLSEVKDHLDFVVVPDILANGAFDEAVQGVKYIVHLASPLASGFKADDDLDVKLIQPAVKGTLAVLEAAKKEPGIKRIVITSSVVALADFPVFAGMQPGTKTFGPNDRPADVPKVSIDICESGEALAGPFADQRCSPTQHPSWPTCNRR
jgi:nucleoside-diphosphate-sugar epimerase